MAIVLVRGLVVLFESIDDEGGGEEGEEEEEEDDEDATERLSEEIAGLGKSGTDSPKGPRRWR